MATGAFTKITLQVFPILSRLEEEKEHVLCQLISEPPVAAVVCHHELLQLVQILSPFVRVQQLQRQDAHEPF